MKNILTSAFAIILSASALSVKELSKDGEDTAF
jgi:hypothetical protein